MLIRVAGTVNDSIVDGPGLRYTVFAQGCPHGCPGCHNPGTHDAMGGKMADTDALLAEMEENPLLDGLTLSGGEPFLQPAACAELARGAKKRGLNVWAYSGFTFEELTQKKEAGIDALLSLIDVLVDGRFVLSLRSLELSYMGSANQRLIDVPASLREGRAVLWTPPVW